MADDADAALVKRLWEVLEVANPSVTTITSIRQQLEAEMGVDLMNKRVLIRQQVDEFLQRQDENSNDESEQLDEQEQEQELHSREEEDEEDEEPGGKSFQAKMKRVIKESMPNCKRSGSAGRKGGFHNMLKLSAELAAFVGRTEASRIEVNKHFWSYIRHNDLQVPGNKKLIRCDDAVKKVLQVDQVDMFELHKLLSKHFFNLRTGT